MRSPLVLIEAVTGEVPFSSDTTIGMLMARVDHDLEVPAALGPLRSAVERAGRLRPTDRPDAEELGILLMAAAERMDAPAPLPMVGALEEARTDDGDDAARTDIVPLPFVDAGADSRQPSDPTTVLAVTPPPARRQATLVPNRRPRAVGAAAGGRSSSPPCSSWRWAPVPSSPWSRSGPPPTRCRRSSAARSPSSSSLHSRTSGHSIEKRARQTGTDPGEIISTTPPSGERLAEGGTLVVVVSEGNSLTDVPTDLIGRPLAEVTAELEGANLGHEVADEVFDETVPEGSVVRLAGDSAEQLPEGATVGLVVSKGPEPRTVPEIASGATYDQVAAQLTGLGLVPARKDVFSNTVDAGAVIGLSSEPGTQVPHGATVTVTVSKGPDLVVVPDVSGKTLDEAEQMLVQAGLVLGQSLGNPRKTVTASSPSAGERVVRGSEVDLLLRR